LFETEHHDDHTGDGGGLGSHKPLPEQDMPDTSLSSMCAALLVDESGQTLRATEPIGSQTFKVSGMVGRHWRELFAEFEPVEIQSDGDPSTFFFLGHESGEAYRVRQCPASPAAGAGGSFIIVEAVGDPSAVRELIYHERMMALGEIAGGVAHEINNPLTTVSGWLQILLSEVGDDEKRRAPLQLMNDEVARIANIVHHLLTFGRRMPSELQLVRTNRLLTDVLALIEYQIRNENIEVMIDLASDLPMVMGDANQLKQVFLNIIVNARQAMPDGGMLTITTDTTADGSIEIALGDTGGGMPAEVIERVFEPFYTTKADRGGSGIGLFLCRNIIKDHDGVMTVSSRPGEGTTFIITLPGACKADMLEHESLADALTAAVASDGDVSVADDGGQESLGPAAGPQQ
jgi:signal transduction histidine kinase